MILAVDIGNTNVVLAGVRDDIVFQSRIVTDDRLSWEAYKQDILRLLHGHGVPVGSIEGAIISSVVPMVTRAIQTALLQITGKPPVIVDMNTKAGLDYCIDHPSELGADLIVGCSYAAREYGVPVIIIDMGTATTLFVVDQSRRLIGGSICPGVGISADALMGRTAQLPDVMLSPPTRAIGRNTIDCMKSGILMGAATMLDGMVSRMEEELGCRASVVITGGIAEAVVPLCRQPMIYEPNLLIKGMAALYRENFAV